MSIRYRTGGGVAAAALALVVASTSLNAQVGSITGSVIDDTNGQPLNGAQISLVDQRDGVLSNVTGQYLMTRLTPGNYTVQVVFVGYATETREVTVTSGEATVENFRLRQSAIRLDQIVVTGTAGEVERRKLGSAPASLDISSINDVSPQAGFGSALEGRIPGVRSIGTVGGVGAGRELRIRGTDSFSLGQRPVIYIDGVRVDSRQVEWGSSAGGSTTCCAFSGGAGEDRLSDLNPDEIERVEVLKGPAAATLYGSEASGGVIQVFTKRGRNNSSANFALTTQLGFNRHRANFPTSLRGTLVGRDGTVPWDPNETLIENGLVNTYNLTVDGGGEDVTYFVNAGIGYEEGSVKPNDQTRGNLRLNLNWTAAEDVTVQVRSGYVRNRIWSLQSGNNWLGIYTNALLSRPTNATAEEPYGGGLDVNVADAKAISTYSDTDRWTGSVQVDWVPSPNFRHQATIGLDAVNDQKTRNLPFGKHYTYIGTVGERNIGYRNARKFTGNYIGTLNYENVFGLTGEIAFGAQGGWDLTSTSMATGRGFAGEGVTTVGGAAETFGGETSLESIQVGGFAQNRFEFTEDLFMTAAVRIDGNSAFGVNYGFQVYPKVDVAYNLPQSMMGSTLSSVKLRGALGYAGKAPGAFSQFQTYLPNTVLDDRPGVSPSNPGNADLEPEIKREIEAGFDIGLVDNRIAVDFTGYHQLIENALLGIALPPSEGFGSSQLRNVGQIMNRGIEATINASLVDRSGFRWNTGFSFEKTQNKILDLGETAELDSLPIYAEGDISNVPVSWEHVNRVGGLYEGYPIFEMIGRGILGWDPATGEHVRSTYGYYRGKGEPDLMGSVWNTFSLGRNLRLHVQFRGEMGASMWNSDRGYGVRQLAYDEYVMHLDSNGDPTAAADSVLNFHRLATPVDSRDHIRLQEASLQFTVPSAISSSMGLSTTTLSLTGYNLHWWDNCNCPDPNQQYRGGDDFSQSPFLGLPQPRRMVLTVRTRF